jgi:hypothetical protein
MAKKDTYLALLRRGVDEVTAQTLADSGVTIGGLKEMNYEQLVGNYGLKIAIAKSVIEVISSGPSKAGRQRYLSKVLSGTKKKMDRIDEQRFRRQQKDFLSELVEQKERLKEAKVEAFRGKKLVMNRLGKSIELICKLENNFDEEMKREQQNKIRDQLETRGLEAARDHEMLELAGTPQDIVDFRRKLVPTLCLHACPECGEEIDPRGGNLNDSNPNGWSFICYDCETEFSAQMVERVEAYLNNGGGIKIDPNKPPRLPIARRPKAKVTSAKDIIRKDLETTGATADELQAAVEESNLSGGLMDINDWIDQTLAAKGYIQAQEDREDFIVATGAGATKFNKWMKKAGLHFNKQTGRWTRWEDR